MSAPVPVFYELDDLLKFAELPDLRWKIGVQPKDSLYWSIALGYLISPGLKDSEAFSRRLGIINGNNLGEKDIKRSLRCYNPFLNRFACFYNENLKKMVENFRQSLKEHRAGYSSGRRNCDNFELASDFLKCKIVVICIQEKETMTSTGVNETTACNVIALYAESKHKLKKTDIFGFGLPKDHGNELKSRALRSILKQVKLLSEEDINEIIALDNVDKNFLFALLQSDCKRFIPKIYRSPYIIGKLADAGYEIDPTTKVCDMSAFCWTLGTEEIELLYVLYNNAANARSSQEHDIRDPDNRIVSNLKRLGDILKEALSEQKTLNAKISSQELYRFNRFQYKITTDMKTLRQKSNTEDLDDEFAATSNKLELIISILAACEEFYFAKSAVDRQDMAKLYDDYLRYGMYYDNFHFYAYLLLFDNLYSLKEMLKQSDNSVYFKFESSIYMSVFCSQFFSMRYHKSHPLFAKSLISDDNERQLRIVPLLERLSLEKQIQDFKEMLTKREGAPRIGIPQKEALLNLSYLPEIKNELLILRLKYYIDTALQVNVEDFKSILIIERALQVLGESLKTNPQNPKSFSRFLVSCLPKDIVCTCINVRNRLSHMQDNRVLASITISDEKLELFSNIQKDLKRINEAFLPVFDFQFFKIYEYMMLRGKQSVDKVIVHATRNEKIFEAFLSVYEGYAHSCEVQKRIPDSTPIGKYKTLLKNLFKEVEKRLEVESNILHERLNNLFWPLEHLLNFIDSYYGETGSKMLHQMMALRRELCKDEQTVATTMLITNLETLLTYLKDTLFKMFPDLQAFAFDILFKCFSIVEFENGLENHPDLSPEEQGDILEHIPEGVLEAHRAKEDLKDSLKEDANKFDCEGRSRRIQMLFLPEDKKEQLSENYENNPKSALRVLMSAKDYYADIEKAFMKNQLNRDTYLFICTNIKLSPFYEDKLKRLVGGQTAREIQGRLQFLQGRIEYMKHILIDNETNVKQMYEKGHSPKTKNHMRDEIVQRYITDKEIQVFVEMLLFDCMTVLEDRRDLRYLWKKTSHLFNRISVRNVLAHGDPLLESVGILLDPEDLSTEIVKKVLQLIEDGEAIDAIAEWIVDNPGDEPKFDAFMNDKEDADNNERRDKIFKCSRWKSYANLVPGIKILITEEIK